ncbi:hypothetical protein JOD54_004419 [Actinokineospora baliensis]|uniref:maleylpyruvate isomerase N-terminal domain-containing protein n=1 Tax=Actinokineospora baliensis TaxID=547056 RepID=UPI0019585805|nr:maleylpyruvate isomerase N-terminal domain-containing protein [Actinokineospora baliensis]MBM7774215.1 hypothetical protein [Actinokineospora baliensis]
MSTDAFLSAARTALTLLRDPAVTAAWDKPSALPEFGVSGLAAHLAYQVLVLPEVLADPIPDEPRIALLDHYSHAAWINEDIDGETNVRIREGGNRLAEGGPVALADRVEAALEEIIAALPTSSGRTVRMRLWGAWSLSLEDMLITRTMELVVHADDLAVSVDVPTPDFPTHTTTVVVDLLTALSLRRHGPIPVIRALSRAERAPDSITAF